MPYACVIVRDENQSKVTKLCTVLCTLKCPLLSLSLFFFLLERSFITWLRRWCTVRDIDWLMHKVLGIHLAPVRVGMERRFALALSFSVSLSLILHIFTFPIVWWGIIFRRLGFKGQKPCFSQVMHSKEHWFSSVSVELLSIPWWGAALILTSYFFLS